MCFDTNRPEDFRRSSGSGSGTPVPSYKPNREVSNNDTSILGSIWDSAQGVFKQYAGVEIERYELKRTAKLRAEEQKARQIRDETLSGRLTSALAFTNAPQTQNTAFLVGAFAIGVGVILLIKES